MKLRLLYYFLLFSSIGLAQNSIEELRKYNLDKVLPEQTQDSSQALKNIEWQVNFLQNFDISHRDFNKILSYKKTNKRGIDDFYFDINLGDYYFYKYQDKNLEAIDHYKKALAFAEEKEDVILQCEALKKILKFHRLKYLYDNYSYLTYLKQYKKIAYDDFELANYHYFNLILNFKNYYLDKWDSFSEAFLINYFKNNNPSFLKGNVYSVFASYAEEKENLELASFYADKAEEAYVAIPYNYKNSRLNNLYSYKSRLSLLKKEYQTARFYIDKSVEKNYSSLDYIIASRAFYQNSVLDSLEGDFFKAYENAKKYRLAIDELDKMRYIESFNELEAKYDLSQKEKDILIEQQKKDRNRNIAIALGGILLLGSIIFFLFQKNTKRKQRITEQEREIEIQKIEKALKEQELNTIDAMLEGQEKERQKLAEDLHDSVGATLAAAKLQFSHLSQHRDKANEMDELFSKTESLLDDAYTEVRAMAHLKNSGVIAKNGLLPALDKLAKNASVKGGLQVSIENFGLEQRLDNTQEITIFRIVQELITNIIKHAEATEASVSLTPFENELSIIIEDNGKGFDPRTAIKKGGMGLVNIERRVEHIEGSMDVDSTPGKGTTILIDIPL